MVGNWLKYVLSTGAFEKSSRTGAFEKSSSNNNTQVQANSKRVPEPNKRLSGYQINVESTGDRNEELTTPQVLLGNLLSCQPRVTVMSCFVYQIIRDLESIDHLCINPIHRI